MISLQFPQADGECVYHYTSVNGVMGILQKNKIVLHLTRANFLNDTTEGVEIFKHLRPVCNALLKRHCITPDQHAEILKLETQHSTVRFTPCWMKDSVTVEETETDTYIMSFSSDPDSLPMWNYYASGGYCLHFNEKYLDYTHLHDLDGYSFDLDYSKVFYDKEAKEKQLEQIILENTQAGKDDYVSCIEYEVKRLQYLFKHDAFSHENEKRLIVHVPRSGKKPTFETRFKPKGGYVVPYIKLETTGNNLPLFTIKGITIGPIANKAFASNSLQLFLANNGYEFANGSIHSSEIPLRALK